MDSLIANARFHFHKRLLETNTLTLTSAGAASLRFDCRHNLSFTPRVRMV